MNSTKNDKVMKLKYHIESEELLKQVVHNNYLIIREMEDVPSGVRLKLLSTLFSSNPTNWRVVGITDNALNVFEQFDFKRVSRMGINRSHLVQRAVQYKEMLFDESAFQSRFHNREVFWQEYLMGDRTVLATSKENMSDQELRYTEIDESLGLFKTKGYAWTHGDEEEDFLKCLFNEKKRSFPTSGRMFQI